MNGKMSQVGTEKSQSVIIKLNIIILRSSMADIQCVFQSMNGKGSIFISNFQAAQDIQLLQSLNIKAILSVARSGLLHHQKEKVPFYLYIPADDHQSYQLYRHFNNTYDFIEQARKESNVLVHCMAGVSRSVTIVMAYLLKKFKTSLSQVIQMIQRKRKKINPNKGFIQQLKKYAQQEGLKCDFEGDQVPFVGRRSTSHQKHQRLQSRSIECRNKLSIKHNRQQQQWKQELQVKDSKTEGECTHYKKEEEKSQSKVDEDSLKKQSVKSDLPELQLKRDNSQSKKSSKEGRMSIEEKINLIRLKIKNDELKSPNIKRAKWLETRTEAKNKDKKEIFNSQQTSQQAQHKLMNDKYYGMFPQNCQVSQLIQQQKTQLMKKERQSSPIYSNEGFQNELYLKSQTLSSKLKIPKQKRTQPKSKC